MWETDMMGGAAVEIKAQQQEYPTERREKMLGLRATLAEVEADRQAGRMGGTPDELETIWMP